MAALAGYASMSRANGHVTDHLSCLHRWS